MLFDDQQFLRTEIKDLALPQRKVKATFYRSTPEPLFEIKTITHALLTNLTHYAMTAANVRHRRVETTSTIADAGARNETVSVRISTINKPKEENATMRDFEDVDGDCNESQPCCDDEFDDWDWDCDWDSDEIEADCEYDFENYPEDFPF